MTVPPITEQDAVDVLTELEKSYIRTARATRHPAPYLKYAAAIRWALSLTAFPVDAPEGPNENS